MSKKKEERWYDFVGIKIPKTLCAAMDAYISSDTHATRSEFIRNAMREKLQRDRPDLFDIAMGKIKEVSHV